MNDLTEAPAHAWPRPSQPLQGGPPGVLFYCATVAAILVAIEANSRGSLGEALIAGLAWIVIGIVWFVGSGSHWLPGDRR